MIDGGLAGPAAHPPRPPGRMGFAVAGLAILLLCAVLVLRVQAERGQVAQARAAAERSYQRRLAVTELLVSLQQAESAQRGYVIVGAPIFLAPYEPARRSMAATLATLDGLYADRPDQLRRLASLRDTIAAKFREMDEVLRLRDARGSASAIARVSDQQGRRLMVDARRTVDAFVAAEDHALADSTGRAARQLALVDRWLLTALAVAMLAAAVALFVVWRARLARHAIELDAWDTLGRLRGVFDHTSDAIMILNPSGSIEAVNAHTTRLLGYDPAEAVRRDVSTVLDIAGGEGSFERRIGIVDGAMIAPLRPDHTARHRDGHEIPVDVALGLMTLADGVHVVASLRDVSERRATERLKEDFVATVSHELRTPLTSVLGALGLLRSGNAGVLPDTARRLVDIAENNSRRLIRLINDILDIDRIGSGRTTLERAVVDLGDVAARALDDAAGLADARDVRLVLVRPDMPVPVFADTERMLQVIGNLLSNAVRFSPAGGEVELRVSRDGDTALATVWDRGPGVPEEFRSRIFGRFAQSQVGAATPGGTGLGLAISREIVRAHGGDITFDNREGGGACFAVGMAVHVDHPVAGDGPVRRVLVCEDDAEAAAVLREMIEVEGYQVDRCGSAREAQALARTGRYAGLVLDLMLPDANGLATVRALRAHAETRDLPVIVVSAFAREGEEDPTAHALDVIDWIDKPVERGRLLHALGVALHRASDGRPTLLHVDDDPDMLEVTALALADRGRMLAATSVSAAREILARTQPDIVILDINLPDGSGLDLLPELLTADGTAVPTIIYSASDVVPELGRPFEAVLVKSRRSLVTLSDTIGSVLARRRDGEGADV